MTETSFGCISYNSYIYNNKIQHQWITRIGINHFKSNQIIWLSRYQNWHWLYLQSTLSNTQKIEIFLHFLHLLSYSTTLSTFFTSLKRLLWFSLIFSGQPPLSALNSSTSKTILAFEILNNLFDEATELQMKYPANQIDELGWCNRAAFQANIQRDGSHDISCIKAIRQNDDLVSHLARLTIWHDLFLEFWLVNTWFSAHDVTMWCNSSQKCTLVKDYKRQKTGFPIVT